MMQVSCPSCKTVLAVKPDMLGKSIRCPRCMTVLQLKAPAGPPAPAAPPPVEAKPAPPPAPPAPPPVDSRPIYFAPPPESSAPEESLFDVPTVSSSALAALAAFAPPPAPNAPPLPKAPPPVPPPAPKPPPDPFHFTTPPIVSPPLSVPELPPPSMFPGKTPPGLMSVPEMRIESPKPLSVPSLGDMPPLSVPSLNDIPPLPPPLPPASQEFGLPPPLPPMEPPARRPRDSANPLDIDKPRRRDTEHEDETRGQGRRRNRDDEDDDRPRRRRRSERRAVPYAATRKVSLPAQLFTLSGMLAIVSILLACYRTLLAFQYGSGPSFLFGAVAALLIQIALCIGFFKASAALRACRGKGLVITMSVLALLCALVRTVSMVSLLFAYLDDEIYPGVLLGLEQLLVGLAVLFNSLAAILTFAALSNADVKDAFDER